MQMLLSDQGPLGHVYIFPASFAQRSLWFLDQLTPGSSLYNMHIGVRMFANLNIIAFEQSINEVVRRHEMLRTVFDAVDGEPVQVVAPFLHIALIITDLRHLDEGEREERAIQIAVEEAQRPFDLAKWPLLRARLLRLGDEEYIFLLTVHHIVCDFLSINVFQRELETLYEAFCFDRPSPLPELPIQYADYAESEWQWLQGPIAATHLEYWKKHLEGLEPLRLPSDGSRLNAPSYGGASHDFPIGGPLYRDLVKLSKEQKVTLFMTMLAAFQTLLHRYSDQDDIAVGTPVANRNRPEVEDLIGFFVNSVVLRTSFSGDPTFRELVVRVREVTLEAFARQELPFEKIVHELNPERDGRQNPIFRIHFQLFSGQSAAKAQSPLAGEIFAAPVETAKFDLAMDLWEYPDDLYAHLEYSTELFSAETILRMEQHFRRLLQGIVADPDQHVSQMPLLLASEQREILHDWNRTTKHFLDEKCLHNLFEAQVERTPDAIALVFRERELTYQELNRRANQLAWYLQSVDVGPRSLVGIFVERSIEMIVGLLGILKTGAAYLPLNPSESAERLRFMMADAKPRIVLTQERFLQSIPLSQAPRFCLDTEWENVAGFTEEKPEQTGSSGDPVYVIYTSGSTGAPKGVQIHSRAVCNHVLWMQASFPLGAEDRALQKYPFNFDASICEIFGTLVCGGRLIMAEPAEHWDISQFVRSLRRHQITVIDVLPSMLQALLDEEDFCACNSLRRVICGGEPLAPELRDLFFSRMSAELHNIYGPTETTIGALSWTCLPEHAGQPVPIGRPVANTQVYIVDRSMNPVPPLVPGELCIAGDQVALGYLNAPELTASKFVLNPFTNIPSRMYRSGDLARYLPDGTIEYLGRMDDQMKIRGYRIEPQEIQTALARHPAVQECAVVPFEGRLAAYVVPVPDAPELWPCVGEYDVYDELLYYAMTHDELRNEAYRSAINAAVAGKVVLDIGAGADIVLSTFCVDAGAERIYAIELREDAWRRASELIQRLGLEEKITLIHGESTNVQLPEKVDVCVSEVLGTIGSSEGVIKILNDARRFLKDDGVMVPRRCVTRFAAVTLPGQLHNAPRLNPLPRYYTEQVFRRIGHPFDLRICIKNLPPSCLLSQPGTLEELDFAGFIEPDDETEATLTIEKDSRLDGFLLWINLSPGPTETIDSLDDKLSWLPVFFPTFYPGVNVTTGDVIEAKWLRRHSVGSFMPNYEISGNLFRESTGPQPFHFCSPYNSASFQESPFYGALFSGLNLQTTASVNGDGQDLQFRAEPPPGLVASLRRFLQEQLPEYMIPSWIHAVERLPRNRSGKVDRRALPHPSKLRRQSEAGGEGHCTELEGIIRKVWSDTLEIDLPGLRDNFFDLGGNSLLIIRVQSRLERLLQRQISIVDLFRYPTVHSLAQFVQDGVRVDSLAAVDDRARRQFEAAASFQNRMGATDYE
jgi:amino acid adenylation domain-containing protein